MASAIERYPKMISFQLKLRVVTEKAFGCACEEDEPDDELVWLPISEVVIHNEWRHAGESYISGKMPRWLAVRNGLRIPGEDS